MKYGTFVREALEEKKKTRELFRKRMISEVFEVLDGLSEKVTFDEAFLFGSLVRPYAFNDHSDIDIGFLNLDNDVFSLPSLFYLNGLGEK